MITTNIDVSDALTNGAMGTITNIVQDVQNNKIKAVLMKFDNDNVGQEARNTSIYRNIDNMSVPIKQIQASFPVKGSPSFHATRTQFPLTLCWGSDNTQMPGSHFT